MPYVELSSRDLGILLVQMRKESREASNQLKRRLRAAAAPLKDAVVQEALANGLEKAAEATRVRQSYTTKGGNVRVVVLDSRARYARWQGGNPRKHRHPVFAPPDETREQWTWVGQLVPPFFTVGTTVGAVAAGQEISKVLGDISDSLGGGHG